MKLKRTESQVIKAIEGSRGIKSHIARRLQISRNTLTKYLEVYPKAREAYHQEESCMLDSAENILYKLAIDQEQERSLHYLLSTRGKKRGYVTREEHTIEAPTPILLNLIPCEDEDEEG